MRRAPEPQRPGLLLLRRRTRGAQRLRLPRVRLRRYPTAYRRGPFALVRLSHRAGYAVIDERHTGPRVRYALTEPHPTTGRPMPRRLPLPEALAALAQLAADT
jgi:hypothetical protein